MARKRYAVLDAVRGLALFNMILYHAAWDMVYLFGADWPWYRSAGAGVWQQAICRTFIFLSGFCHPFGRHPWRRGALVFSAGLLVSAVTCLLMPENAVLFGVLTLLGSCTLLLQAARPLLEKCPPAPGALGALALFALFRNAPRGFLGFGSAVLCRLPQELYRNLLTAYLGFPPQDFFSTDYFPLLPWLFLFAAGMFCCRLVEKRGMPAFLEKSLCPPLEWLGRHSLLLYLLHQPVLYLLLQLLF